MTTWLSKAAAALDRCASDARFFFRDDDAGWDRSRLVMLLDLFEKYDTPIDLAVIPAALDTSLADELANRRRKSPGLLGLHQHGFRHLNYELQGQKCEFGLGRSRAEQELDLQAGQRRLIEILGEESLDKIFTPPWNRCTQTTVDCLAKLGFNALSRDVTAAPLYPSGLFELSVRVDWCKATGSLAEKRVVRRDWIAAAIEVNPVVGIMLHHAVMNDEDFADIEQLLILLNKNGESPCYPMSQLIEQSVSTIVA
jgi:peptidoglycan/xylan/chitin deacetylase (PgdA/CDA1 family)